MTRDEIEKLSLLDLDLAIANLMEPVGSSVVPHYSSDAAEALRLIESTDRRWTLTRHLNGWLVSIRDKVREPVDAITFSESVARAYLIAMQGET